MAEWLYEAGIGEARAALIDEGRLVEMCIEPEATGPRAGAVLAAQLVRKADASGRGRVELAEGDEAWLIGPAEGLAEGARLRVEVVREALPEGATLKPAQVRRVEEDRPLVPGPDLAARIGASGISVRAQPASSDPLEAHGWSERLEEAASGVVARPEALLRIALTPAMTLIDVDGPGDATTLAIAGVRLAGETIRRFGIAGSIGIDLPTLSARAYRQAAAAALDAALPQPFERTAVNGFGFLQIVRRRVRASLPEQQAADPIGAAARTLLRRAERAEGRGSLTLTAAPAVVARLAATPAWTNELARRTGAPVILSAVEGLAISAGHAQHAFA